MKVEMPQIPHKLGDIKNNFNLILDTLGNSDADLVIFPETFLTGYLNRDKIIQLALPLENEYIEQLQTAVKKNERGLIFGMPEKHPNIRGLVHNTAVFIDKNGLIDAYRKTHMVNFGPFEERRYFTPGNIPHMMRHGDCRFGLIICYDIFFPELSKFYALQGADMIICISAAPSTTLPFFKKVMLARAIENTTFVLYSNIMGTEKNLVFAGGNTIVGPRGEIKAESKEFEEDTLKVDIDLSELNAARENRPTLRDTRFELYEAIAGLGKGDKK
jgi:predicted amidohydrolase